MELRSADFAGIKRIQAILHPQPFGTSIALSKIHAHATPMKDVAMDLAFWIPTTLALGVIALALMFFFIEACDWV
jgi:hypothetical protein